MIEDIDLDNIVGVGNDVTNLVVDANTYSCNGAVYTRNGGGIRFYAEGHNFRSTTNGIAVEVKPGSRYVEIQQGTILNTGWIGFKVGEEKRAALNGDFFVLSGTRVEGDQGSFGGHIRNYDFWLRDVVFDCALGQHNLYSGGWGQYGAKLTNCDFVRGNQFGEEAKFVCRPGWEALRPHQTDWNVIIEQCTFANAGAGIVVQGSGANVTIYQTIIRDCKAPIRFDDGLSPNQIPWSEYDPSLPYGPGRYWDHQGVIEGPGSANRGLLIDQVIVEKAVGGSNELVRIGKEIPKGGNTWPHTVFMATTVRNSGFYGQGTYLSVPASNTLGQQTIYSTPASIDLYAQSLGIDTTHHAAVNQ